ncbi:Clathrin heavy chain, partial [Tilletia horrida]
CFNDELYEAARILFSSISNYARLATTYLSLNQWDEAVSAARKAGNTSVWRQVLKATLSRREFKLAEVAGLAIVPQAELLDDVVKEYHQAGAFDELVALLENSLGMERAHKHKALFTQTAIAISMFRPNGLMEWLRTYWGRCSLPAVIKVTREAHQWDATIFCLMKDAGIDSATLTMLEHASDAFNHDIMLEILPKVSNTEILYRAASFYLEQHPLLLNDLLAHITQRPQADRIVRLFRKSDNLPLVRSWLASVYADKDHPEVTDAYFSLLLEEEEPALLRTAITSVTNFDQMTLAGQLQIHPLLAFRKISAELYKRAGQHAKAIEVAKEDRLLREIIEIAGDSNDVEIAHEVLDYFVAMGMKEQFAALLYGCYHLLEEDVILETAEDSFSPPEWEDEPSSRKPKPAPNTSGRTCHKAWLASVLSGTSEERRKKLDVIRQMTIAFSRAEHLASWFVLYIIASEYYEPTAVVEPGAGDSHIQMFMIDKGRSNSCLGSMYEEAIQFCNSGTVRTIAKRAGGAPRRECLHLIARYGSQFRELVKLNPMNGTLSEASLKASGTRWSEAYKTAIQERLYPAILRATNVLLNADLARSLLKSSSDPRIKDAAQKRLDEIKVFKKWVNQPEQVNLDTKMKATMRVFKVLGPILERYRGLQEDTDKKPMSLQASITRKHIQFFGLFLDISALFATHSMLKGTRPPLSLPRRRSLIPPHIRLDASSLSAIDARIKYDCRSSTATAELYTAHEQERQQAWRTVFQLNKRPFCDTHKWTLNSSVVTDGYSIGVQKKLKANESPLARLRKEKSKRRAPQSSRGSAAAERARRIKTAATARYPELSDLTDQQILETAGTEVFVDPGKHNLLYCVSGDHVKSKFGKGLFVYSSRSRARGLGSLMFARRRRQMERNMDPRLQAKLNEFRSESFPSARAFTQSNVEQWLRIWGHYHLSMAEIWEKPIHRSSKMRGFTRAQREVDKLVANLTQAFGTQATFFVGNWSSGSMKHLPPTLRRSTLQDMLSKAGFTVYSVDEFRTSSYCPTCFERVKSSTSTRQPIHKLRLRRFVKMRSPRGLLICTSEKCKATCGGSGRFWNRDLMATLNMRILFRHRLACVLRGEPASRPPHLRRRTRGKAISTGEDIGSAAEDEGDVQEGEDWTEEMEQETDDDERSGEE